MKPHISIPAMDAPFRRKTFQRCARFHGKPPISRRSHWQESPRGDAAVAEPHKRVCGLRRLLGEQTDRRDRNSKFGGDKWLPARGTRPHILLLATNEDSYSTGQVSAPSAATAARDRHRAVGGCYTRTRTYSPGASPSGSSLPAPGSRAGTF